VTPPKENEPPVPLPEPGMMSEFAPPKDADDMARRARLKALEGKLKRPLDAPAPPRTPKSGKPEDEEHAKSEPAPAAEPVPLDDAMESTPAMNQSEPIAPAPVRPIAPSTRPSLAPAPTGPDAAVDLPEVNRRRAQPAPVSTGGESTGKSSWVYLNGRWVQVRRPGGSSGDTDGLLGGGEPVGLNASAPTGPLFAQKVIKVSLEALFRGDSSYNIVIRPGDVVRIPPPPEGEVYVAGQVLRPGSYQLSQSGGAFTVTRAIVAAGGLGEEAIPERVDLVRIVGNNQQAMMRIDLRAMYEGTQPDILLKKDDMINVGSNFWAFPLAVIRNGFRANYGFGFLLDRNFGSDVFGVPPESRSRF
jgi:hypothetical protein